MKTYEGLIKVPVTVQANSAIEASRSMRAAYFASEHKILSYGVRRDNSKEINTTVHVKVKI